MPRTVRRLLDVVNEHAVYAVLFLTMAVQNVQGPTWPTVAKYAVGAAVGIGAWTLKERLDQQEKIDAEQNATLKEALRDNREALDRFGANNDKAMQQVRDLSSSAVSRAGEAISASLELGKAVNDLKDELKNERQKREFREQQELDELRKDREKKK
jgi:hypothetical protein